MKTKRILTVTAIVTIISACGGGGGDSSNEPSNQTGSNPQTRTELTSDISISFVKKAIGEANNMDLFDRFLVPWAPADTSATTVDSKDLAIDTCKRVSTDPNCKGNIRFEAEFPTKEPQQVLKANSKLIVQWEEIEGSDFTLNGPINARWTFTFAEDFSLTSRYSGKFSLDINRTTPTQLSLVDRYELDQLTVRLSDTPGVGYVINGRYLVNPYTGIGLNVSEEITFSNWSLNRSARSPGAQAKFRSSRYLENNIGVNAPKNNITVTVVSSDASRTEYRVMAKADNNDIGTTRTVIGIFDGNGSVVYTAS